MFQFIQLILLLSFSQISCHNMNISEPTREVFVQKVDNKYKNYIEFIKEGDSIKGVFYGEELALPLKSPLYYKSNLIDLKIEADKIIFTLSTFLFSNESFYDNPNASLLNKSSLNDIPFLFNNPIKYFGIKQGDTLRMNKITILDDSKSTEVIFVKKS